MVKLPLTLISCVFALALTSQNNFTKKIDSIIEASIDKNDPGMMVGVVKNGQIIYEKYYILDKVNSWKLVFF